MTQMEENRQQQQPPPKFEDIFTLNQQKAAAAAAAAVTHHHHYTPPPPPSTYVFSQLQQNLAPPPPPQGLPQGFLEFHQHNSFRPFMSQQQRRMLRESVNSGASPSITPSASAPGFSLSFKADLDGSGAFGCGGGGGEEDSRRATAAATDYGWQQTQEDSTAAIRQPFWKSLGSELTEKGGNGTKEKEVVEQAAEMNGTRYFGEEITENECFGTRKARRLLGELEEICRNASANGKEGNAVGDGSVENFETFATIAANAAAAVIPAVPAAENTSGGGVGDDGGGGDEEIRKERMMMREEMNSMVAFIEGLICQLSENQESLHKKFMAVIEKLDEERKAREEEWRRKESERFKQEAALRATERALATQMEAMIVSYLEKITGQTIHLPPRINPELELSSSNKAGNGAGRSGSDLSLSLRNRWPKSEVQALIQVRTELEKKFQAPGYKGPLWDEVSNVMTSMGFQRTAKRCKEKWENINKYFKKSREKEKSKSSSSSKQSRKKLKTCQYFDQLDQLYSKSSGVVINGGSKYSSSSSSEQQQQPNPNVESFVDPPTPAPLAITGIVEEQKNGEEEEE